jgi:Phytanoyl-CoA dioxygenase (PhyH)
MNETLSGPVTAQGRPVDLSASALGELRRTANDALDVDLLRAGLDNDGYLYLPGFLPRDEVLAARHDILARMATAGFLEEGSDPDEARPSANLGRSMLSDIALASSPLQKLLYSGRMIELYETLLDVPVRHFDFTWLRAYPPGPGTAPHMDNVFMSRGSSRLLSAWVPLGDIGTTLGGLAVLEGSHRLDEIRATYASRDVDTYCSNEPGAASYATQETMVWNGQVSSDPVGLREELGLRWLTNNYEAGDVVTFPMFTVHTGFDNNSDRIRLSSDSRYQPAADPADPRWVGPNPSAHGSRSKVGMIC